MQPSLKIACSAAWPASRPRSCRACGSMAAPRSWAPRSSPATSAPATCRTGPSSNPMPSSCAPRWPTGCSTAWTFPHWTASWRPTAWSPPKTWRATAWPFPSSMARTCCYPQARPPPTWARPWPSSSTTTSRAFALPRKGCRPRPASSATAASRARWTVRPGACSAMCARAAPRPLTTTCSPACAMPRCSPPNASRWSGRRSPRPTRSRRAACARPSRSPRSWPRRPPTGWCCSATTPRNRWTRPRWNPTTPTAGMTRPRKACTWCWPRNRRTKWPNGQRRWCRPAGSRSSAFSCTRATRWATAPRTTRPCPTTAWSARCMRTASPCAWPMTGSSSSSPRSSAMPSRSTTPWPSTGRPASSRAWWPT